MSRIENNERKPTNISPKNHIILDLITLHVI